MSACPAPTAVRICQASDLVKGSGVAALVGEEQIAIFYLPNEQPAVYAVGNYDPIGGAHVMSRGVVGDIGGELCVASPLYKQHFSLTSGQCIEQPEHALPIYSCELRGDELWLTV